jgi:hypothetical protein
MTPEQIKIAVARELGDNLPFDALPDYPNDRNTQPEMLAAMTKEEKEHLYDLATREHTAEEYSDLVLILELSQLEFTTLFLKVKGKWVE